MSSNFWPFKISVVGNTLSPTLLRGRVQWGGIVSSVRWVENDCDDYDDNNKTVRERDILHVCQLVCIRGVLMVAGR